MIDESQLKSDFLMTKGLLLINLGTPYKPKVTEVKAFLREFLTDKRVIDLPAFIRYILVYGIILPFRSKQSTHAYQSIWTDRGSPLLQHSEDLIKELQGSVGEHFTIALGMRYGNPSIYTALQQLKNCTSITVLPLYPQYSSAATGSSLEKTMHLIAQQQVIPSLKIISNFYQHPAYIKAQAELINNHLKDEYLLLSYHGIPERQIHKSSCLKVCHTVCPTISMVNQDCYRAQCYQTSRLIAEHLHLSSEKYSTSFQSRLGKTPWIKPYTDEVFKELATKGIKKLAVACPSFVADCLETLEEIGIRAKEQWFQLGGEQFRLIPCLNEEKLWICAINEMINE